MVLIALLVTTWLHYRKKRRQHLEETKAPSHARDWSYPSPATTYQSFAGNFSDKSARPSGNLSTGDPTAALPKENGNAYRGLLWMKDKYEQYREQTDRKIEKLKEELARSEEKYLNLLASRSPLPQDSSPQEVAILSQENSQQEQENEEASLHHQVEEKNRLINLLQLELEERIKNFHQLEYQGQEDKARAEELNEQYVKTEELLAARQLKIEELNQQLTREKDKAADLAAKLECNIRLLRHIHQEMDRSLNAEESGPGQSPPLSEVSKIVGWV